MKRKAFFKSLVTLIVAPKVIAEIKPTIDVVSESTWSVTDLDEITTTFYSSPTEGITKSLISDLQLLTPQFYKQWVEKYGINEYSTKLNSLSKTT